MAKFLVDTCVWRDFFEDRIGGNGIELGKAAAGFIAKVRKRRDLILLTQGVISELGRIYEANDAAFAALLRAKCLQIVQPALPEREEAERLSSERNLPYIDCLNAVQAKEQGATVVTQDKHFNRLRDVAPALRPDEIV